MKTMARLSLPIQTTSLVSWIKLITVYNSSQIHHME